MNSKTKSLKPVPPVGVLIFYFLCLSIISIAAGNGLLAQQTQQENSTQPLVQEVELADLADDLPPFYLIGPKDLLTISVLEAPELNITTRVSEAGNITVPLLGIVKVDGLTRDLAEAKIASLLAKSYIKNPNVTIYIKEYKSRNVSVIGAVNSPGSYEVVGKKFLLEMLGAAGWVSDRATGDIDIVRRSSPDKPEQLTINLLELTENVVDGKNPEINAGDIIIVHAFKYCDIYIFGQVNQPGLITMKQDKDLTLMRVIVKAGGFSDRARKGSVTVKRVEKNGEEIIIKVSVRDILKGKDTDFKLQPNDIVYVPESLL